MKVIKAIGHLIFIVLLTALTQLGGFIWLICLIISYKTKKRKRIMFPLLYLAFNLIIIPPLAKVFGREQLPVFNKELKPRNWIYPLLFRNYVNPRLKIELEDSAHVLFISHNISISYLDANFPFIDGYPLLPHLSHSDGKKIDICFQYLDSNKKPTDKKPSTSGYGIYVNSEKSYRIKSCLNKGYWQYDFTKYLTFGAINDLELDKIKTKLLIKHLLSNNQTQKIFIEPHLKQSLGLSHENKIRFHGCQAVRHDDHIHLQIK